MSGPVRIGWGLVLVAALGVSCRPPTGTVSGKVSFNGTLLKGGAVTFFCADGKAIPTEVREDGSYLVSNLAPGKAKVCVDTRPRGYFYNPPPGAKPGPGGRLPGPVAYVEIPGHYADQETTDLVCEVAGGSQKYDIQLKQP